MSLPHSAAGRSRSVDARAFFLESVARTTQVEATPNPPSFPYGWKNALKDRIWDEDGPKGNFARSVLEVLVRHADANGRTWIGVQTIARKAGIGNDRTVRTALESLARDGWLHIAPQTWASLTVEQQAAGRPIPRRADVGQAPNLYQVLDGRGNPVTSEAAPTSSTTTRPGLARVSPSNSAAPQLDQTPRQICQGGPGQIGRGEPRADLPVDLDPVKSVSRKESAEPARGTHHFSKAREEDAHWLGAWELLVEAHAEKTKSAFGLRPSKPDVRRDDRQKMAECLIEAVSEVRAKLQQLGIERDAAEIQRDLAARVMRFYFKHESEHLRRVRWALRDLPREIDARMIDAMQTLLRQSHDSAPPRQVQLELPALETTAKPVDVAKPQPLESQPQPAPQAAAAREVQSIIAEFLSAPIPQEPKPRRVEITPPPPPPPAKPGLPDWFVEELQREQLAPDNPEPTSPASPPILRSNGRLGAPRWGSIGPRPAKVKQVSDRKHDDPGSEEGRGVPDAAVTAAQFAQLDDPGSEEGQGGGSTPENVV